MVGSEICFNVEDTSESETSPFQIDLDNEQQMVLLKIVGNRLREATMFLAATCQCCFCTVFTYRCQVVRCYKLITLQVMCK